MRVVFSTVLIILVSSSLGKEATLEQHLKEDSELSQVSLATPEIDKRLYNPPCPTVQVDFRADLMCVRVLRWPRNPD